VSNLHDLDRIVAQIHEAKGKLDIVFANAGVAQYAALDEVTEELYDSIFNINVKGMLFTVQKALPLMPDGAAIMVTSSIVGSKGLPNKVSGACHGRPCRYPQQSTPFISPSWNLNGLVAFTIEFQLPREGVMPQSLKSNRLPKSFPVGTTYVVEGQGGEHGQLLVSSRYVVLPGGQRIEIAGQGHSVQPVRRAQAWPFQRSQVAD
jgi:hypothetical protein